MSMLILAAFLFGTLLGIRFKVLVLIPVIGLALLATVTAGLIHRDSASAILVAAALNACGLQFGYLFGVVARHSVIMARGHHREKATLQGKIVR